MSAAHQRAHIRARPVWHTAAAGQADTASASVAQVPVGTLFSAGKPSATGAASGCVRACRYQSATLGTFQTSELIETFVNYHENIKKCVCIIYDPQRSQRGSLALHAIRVRDTFVDLFKGDKLSAKELRDAGVSWKDIFVDVPIKVRV